MTNALMIQGTGSDVGKSLLVAGIARALTNRGMKVKPFKPQNMSNNAAVTVEGGEIGRAQALQARAARAPLLNDMNPVLLKPQSMVGAQVILQGKIWGNANAREFQKVKPEFLSKAVESFRRLGEDADIVIVEGAGSPAEVNLRKNDIANMGFAEAADIPVLLAGDIDRGGVIAQIAGTHLLLSDSEKQRTKGFIVNKFRGDPTLFDDGMSILEEKTGWENFGLVPFFQDAHKLPPEDAFSIQSTQKNTTDKIRIVVPVLPRISNFDDLDPLHAEPDVSVEMIKPGTPLPIGADLILLPGSKATIADMKAIEDCGWDLDIKVHLRQGGSIFGICGGLQMLGQKITDPKGIEGDIPSIDGLGFLEFETELSGDKKLLEEAGEDLLTGNRISGYHMHVGECRGEAIQRPFAQLASGSDGVMSKDGRVMGTYLHGVFANDHFRQKFLSRFRDGTIALLAFEEQVEKALDDLSDHLETHMKLDRLVEVANAAN
ncbi:cobyric acid synthase [Sneathiella sp. P13V-1]|uniref:cobyric acid synthase n=1 Tax=Sneathiella sp. P13V-1 TaxID=2697366 RepID=UPI00187B64A0|nr:cobyric acid synthase [Sneathiella sp. P13V-1]MBE7638134.1 cobyric acid synthase [Sneathiella sp. P13V-1]